MLAEWLMRKEEVLDDLATALRSQVGGWDKDWETYLSTDEQL